MKHLLITANAANYEFSSIPWWCYLIVFLLLFGFIKKRLGQTIHKHAIEGNIRAIKKLVNSKGMTCLEAKDKEGCSPLHYAAVGGHKEVAEYLIDNNSDVNVSDPAGCTPLHAAAMLGHIEIIRLLHKNNELCAQEVENHFYLEQSTTSHHLNTLKRAGISKSRKQGRKVFYSIDYDQLKSTLTLFEKLIS